MPVPELRTFPMEKRDSSAKAKTEGGCYHEGVYRFSGRSVRWVLCCSERAYTSRNGSLGENITMNLNPL